MELLYAPHECPGAAKQGCCDVLTHPRLASGDRARVRARGASRDRARVRARDRGAALKKYCRPLLTHKQTQQTKLGEGARNKQP